MPDDWEYNMGLQPRDPTDALSDLDGDHVPNLWEYSRGTSANNATSVTVINAIVDAYLPADDLTANPPKFKTLQSAYNYLPSVDGFRFVVKVLRGKHAAQLDTSGAPKKVAWLAEGGYHRLSGLEGAILVPRGAGDSLKNGLTFTDETYLDGFIIDGSDSSQLTKPAISLLPDPAVAGYKSRIKSAADRGSKVSHL